jgi:hypothetical protein
LEDLPTCCDCRVRIRDDIKALQCDRCGGDDGTGTWKCCGCLNISTDIYEALSGNSPLKWFCDQCEADLNEHVSMSQSDTKVDKMLEMVGKMMEKFDSFEEKLKNKASTEAVSSLGHD